ncbi:MAG: hypothetical protein Phog2KO_47130 [Phototrophicaceae bacterium]
MDSKATIWRAISTIVVWVAVAGSVALTGVFLAPSLGEDALGAIFMILVAAVVTNGFIWNWGAGDGSSKKSKKDRKAAEEELYDMALDRQQKRKRDNIGSRLSDFSDDELIDLRQRLQSGEISEDDLEYILRQ